MSKLPNPFSELDPKTLDDLDELCALAGDEPAPRFELNEEIFLIDIEEMPLFLRRSA